MKAKILIPLANGSEELEAVAIIDVLRRANFDVVVASDVSPVICSRKTKILPDALIKDNFNFDEFDAIILPGGLGGTQNFKRNDKLLKAIASFKKKNKLIGAICAAPTALLAAGAISKSDKVTSHPSVKNEFYSSQYLENSVVQSGKILTSRGAGTAIDFALKLVELLAGVQKAKEIAEAIVYSNYGEK